MTMVLCVKHRFLVLVVELFVRICAVLDLSAIIKCRAI